MLLKLTELQRCSKKNHFRSMKTKRTKELRTQHTKLLEKTPRLIIMPCVSHSSAIAAKNSCSTFPDVDYVIKLLPSFLNTSPKRTAIHRNIVLELKYVFQKIPSHFETRWLVRHQCILFISKNWNVIIEFLIVLESEKVKEAQYMLKKCKIL